MTRLGLGVGLLVWAGATLLLSSTTRINRPSLTERLQPYHPGGHIHRRQNQAPSLLATWAPLVRRGGDGLAQMFGIGEDLGTRLRRIHSPIDPTAFRLRQFVWSAAGCGAGVTIALATRSPFALDLLLVFGLPLLAFLIVEQHLSRASAAWQEQLRRELPVVGEQIAMLLDAGYSLGAAVNRVAGRGSGCAARDLRQVANRIRQGVSESEALAEWASVARVEALDRLVAVLALDSAAGDLGRLVALEAGQARRDLHRHTIELIDKRAEQVWIPVTVATLVPGVILLAVPFISALSVFANA